MIHKFKLKNGDPARPFDSLEAMEQHIIAQHNERVAKTDHWYCLGDVAMRAPDLDRILPQLNGIKHLIAGNHDVFRVSRYLQYFEDVHASGWLFDDGLLFSHLPVAPWSMGKTTKANIHGHTHMSLPLTYRAANPLTTGFQTSKLYVNISLERTHYRPVSLEEITRWVDQWSRL